LNNYNQRDYFLFNIQMMNESLMRKDQISRKLKLIANIKFGQKIDTSTEKIYGNSIATSLTRTFWTVLGHPGMTHEDLYTFIQTTMDEAYEFLYEFRESSNSIDVEYYKALLSDVIDAKNAIKTRIRETYRDKPNFAIRLGQLAESIELRFNQIKNYEIDTSLILGKSRPRDIDTISVRSAPIESNAINTTPPLSWPRTSYPHLSPKKNEESHSAESS